MHHLEMPEVFAGASIQGQQAIGIQIGALAIRAVEIVSRRAQREIGYAALFIDGDFAPGVGAPDVLPGIRGPGFITRVSPG